MAQGRQNALQVAHYLRFKVNFNDAASGVAVLKQWLPKGAIITSTNVYVGTAFNAGTSNDITVGTVGDAANNIAATADLTETATGETLSIKPTGAALGPLAAPKQVQVTYTQSGTPATAGFAIIIIHYIPDNDL